MLPLLYSLHFLVPAFIVALYRDLPLIRVDPRPPPRLLPPPPLHPPWATPLERKYLSPVLPR